MDTVTALISAWALGVLLVSWLLLYKTMYPTPAMEQALRPLKAFPRMAITSLILMILAWPISVPVLYYQGYREEKREREKE